MHIAVYSVGLKGSRCSDRGSRCSDRGSRCRDPGAESRHSAVSRIRDDDPGRGAGSRIAVLLSFLNDVLRSCKVSK